MDILANILGSSDQKTLQRPTTLQKPFFVKPKGKEISINPSLEKKVKYIKKSENYELTLQINGKTIFQNLILTASAQIENEKGELIQIPILCKWKRINKDTIIYIKNINSFSYMPNAEDIGYIIEVEVSLYDNPKDISIAQYGPIEMDNDMKQTIEIFLTSGKAHFNFEIFDNEKQEKINNKEYILYLENDGMKLVDVDINRKEKVLEKCRYSQFNPIINLHPTNIKRFTMKFCDIQNNINYLNYAEDIEKFSQSIKSQYEFLALSKQNRELMYLVIQFFVIDEKIKNNKIFSFQNYKNFSAETKVSITDLIGQLKTLNEENTIMMKNMKILERVNKKLHLDLKNLEEDFQITLEKINESDLNIEDEINKNQKVINNNYNNGNNVNNNIKKSNFGNNSSLLNSDWKKKYEEMNNLYNSLLAKEKALTEEKNEYINKEENNKNIIEKYKIELSELKEKNSNLDNDLKIVNKNYTIITEEKTKLNTEIFKLKNENEELRKSNNKLKENLNQISKYKELEELVNKYKKENEKLLFDNKNLILQRNLLSNQRTDALKELEKLKNLKTSKESEINSLKLEVENSKKLEIERIKKVQNLNTLNEDLQKKYDELKNKNEILLIDYNTIKQAYDKLIENQNEVSMDTNRSNVKISPEEYEEFDNLKKEKDENEALIMQLQSNNQAKDLEIKNLKMIIESFKKK